MSLQVITVSIDKLKSSHDGFQLDGIIHVEVEATQTYKYFSLARAQDAYALIRGAL